MRPTRLRLPIRLPILAFLAAVPAAAFSDEPSGTTAIQGCSVVEGLRITDADGDGIPDLMLVSGREVRIFRGTKGGPIAPAPTWTYKVPDAATFTWPGRVFGDAPARLPSLLALSGSQAVRLLPDKPPIVDREKSPTRW